MHAPLHILPQPFAMIMQKYFSQTTIPSTPKNSSLDLTALLNVASLPNPPDHITCISPHNSTNPAPLS
jgi:hypothetical protein